VRAAVLRAPNGPPIFDVFDDPVAAPGTSLLTVVAAGVHHIDLARAAGALGPPVLPSVVGTDGIGVTSDGRRVYFQSPVSPHGSWAERTAVDDLDLLEPHQELDDVTAAALGNSGLAAWLALNWRAAMRPGERVLVLGASGAVGSLATQAARILGAGVVVALVRSSCSRGAPVPSGADAAVTYQTGGEANLSEALLEASGGSGFDVIIDPVWGRVAAPAMRAAARHARYVQLGDAAGPAPALPGGLLRRPRLNLLGFSVFDVPSSHRREAYARLTAGAADGSIRLDVEPVPLSDVEEAWRRQRQGPGVKLVLVP